MSQEGVNCTLQQNVSYSVSPHITSHGADARQRNIDYVAVQEQVSTNQGNDEEVYETMDNNLVHPPPPLYEDVLDPDCDHNQSYNVNPAPVHLRFNAHNPVVGNGTSDESLNETYDDIVPTRGSTCTRTGIIHSGVGDTNQGNDEEIYETMDDPPPSQPPITVVHMSARKARIHTGTGGEHFRLGMILLILTIVFCQLHLLLCAIPAIVFSVKARKYKSTGDLERAKHFDKYSVRLIISGLVFLMLLWLSPFIAVGIVIIWSIANPYEPTAE